MKTYQYLKEIKQFIGDHVIYDEWGGGYIWGISKKDGHQLIAQVENVDQTNTIKNHIKETPIISIRGWGTIQNIFDTREKQEQFQDELGYFIAEAVNEKLNKQQ